MTREENIRAVLECVFSQSREDLIDIAVKNIMELKQEPCEDLEREYEKSKALFSKIVKDEDTISRKSVMMEIIKRKGKGDLYDAIKKLPSVTPSITRDIEKSNFSQEQYLLDTDTAYKIGYEQGKKDSRRKGHWIPNEYFYGTYDYTCSECKKHSDERSEFCPKCGAEMESE